MRDYVTTAFSGGVSVSVSTGSWLYRIILLVVFRHSSCIVIQIAKNIAIPSYPGGLLPITVGNS